MANAGTEELFVSTVEIDGRSLNVAVIISFDEIEHVGHLSFRDADWDDDPGVTDLGVLSARSPEEVLQLARALSVQDLTLRYRRALAHKRRFHGLRRITVEVLEQIKYLNRVATSMRAGLLDVDEAASEIANTERRLHEMVGQLRIFAGVTG